MSNEWSPEWKPEAVLGRLAVSAGGPDAPVSVQLFLSDDVAPDDIVRVAREALLTAAQATGDPPASIDLGKPHPLACSIRATAPVKVLREAMKHHAIKGLLPEGLPADQVLIKPVPGAPPAL